MHRKAIPRLQREVATERCPGNRIGKGQAGARTQTEDSTEYESLFWEGQLGELALGKEFHSAGTGIEKPETGGINQHKETLVGQNH